MTRQVDRKNPLLLPAEVAHLFGVNPKTVTRWVADGKIGAIKTLGNHHRFHPKEVKLLLQKQYTGHSLEDRLEHLEKIVASKQSG